MTHHQIRRGLDIPAAGKASGDVIQLDTPSSIAIDPREFAGMIPRLAARAGDSVKRGQPLFFHKFNQELCVTSPVSGRIAEVKRGARRVIEAIVVDVDGDQAEPLKVWNTGDLKNISRQDATAQLLKSGLFTSLRTRPLDQVPDPTVTPQSILISATETGPAMPGATELLSPKDQEALQAAVYVLGALTDGPVFLTTAQGESHPALEGIQGAELHTFSGPHPAGDNAVQVSYVDPPRAESARVWAIKAWDAVLIGRAFLEGSVPSDRVYTVSGEGVTPRIVRTVLGAPLDHVLGKVEGDRRIINGSVLTGTETTIHGPASAVTRGIYVLNNVVEREFIGWAIPQPSKFSFHKALLGGRRGRSGLTTAMNGGHRAIIPSNSYARVVATPDIEPLFLFKAIMAGDVEDAVSLGLLDLSAEEAALCSYVCPSKTDFDVVFADGIETYVRECV